MKSEAPAPAAAIPLAGGKPATVQPSGIPRVAKVAVTAFRAVRRPIAGLAFSSNPMAPTARPTVALGAGGD